MTTTNKIYVAEITDDTTKKPTLKDVATINDTKIEIQLSYKELGLSTIYSDIVSYISNDKIYGNSTLDVTFSIDDKTATLFDVLRYRRCTVYLVCMQYENKVRQLAFFYDKIMHSRESFGTTCAMSLTNTTELNDMRKRFSNYIS